MLVCAGTDSLPGWWPGPAHCDHWPELVTSHPWVKCHTGSHQLRGTLFNIEFMEFWSRNPYQWSLFEVLWPSRSLFTRDQLSSAGWLASCPRLAAAAPAVSSWPGARLTQRPGPGLTSRSSVSTRGNKYQHGFRNILNFIELLFYKGLLCLLSSCTTHNKAWINLAAFSVSSYISHFSFH